MIFLIFDDLFEDFGGDQYADLDPLIPREKYMHTPGVLESSPEVGSNPYLSLVLNLDQYLIEISKFFTAPSVSSWDCTVHCQV